MIDHYAGSPPLAGGSQAKEKGVLSKQYPRFIYSNPAIAVLPAFIRERVIVAITLQRPYRQFPSLKPTTSSDVCPFGHPARGYSLIHSLSPSWRCPDHRPKTAGRVPATLPIPVLPEPIHVTRRLKRYHSRNVKLIDKIA